MAKKTKRGGPTGIQGMSLAQLEAIVAERRATALKTLSARRSKLARELARVEKELAAVTGAAPKRGPGRPRKKATKKKRGRPKKKVAKKKVAKKKVAKKAKKGRCK